MDYVTFKLNKEKDLFDIDFGSGLNKMYPSLSPLQRTLHTSLIGDVAMPESESDHSVEGV